MDANTVDNLNWDEDTTPDAPWPDQASTSMDAKAVDKSNWDWDTTPDAPPANNARIDEPTVDATSGGPSSEEVPNTSTNLDMTSTDNPDEVLKPDTEHEPEFDDAGRYGESGSGKLERKVQGQELTCFKCGGDHMKSDCTSFAFRLKKFPAHVTNDEIAKRFPTAMKVDQFTSKKSGVPFVKVWFRGRADADAEL